MIVHGCLVPCCMLFCLAKYTKVYKSVHPLHKRCAPGKPLDVALTGRALVLGIGCCDCADAGQDEGNLSGAGIADCSAGMEVDSAADACTSVEVVVGQCEKCCHQPFVAMEEPPIHLQECQPAPTIVLFEQQ